MVKELLSPFNWDSTNDLSDVFDNEDVILEYLKGRFEHGKIYTWVGPLLLAINPGRAIAVDHYSRAEYEKHAESSNVTQGDVEPHVFALAARARYRLAHNLGKACQVIVISGDSGAGKTFTARMALDFLAKTNQNHPVHPDKVSDMLRKISSAYPLIAAFSTASTERNAYSSRHGQLIRLQYVGGIIQGASIHSFLLERSRVTKGGNNYHVFYQLLAGLPEPELKMLGLSREAKYRIIGGTGFEGLKERLIKDFREVLMAINDLGFTDSCRNDIFKVIALVIHLGNVQFKDDKRGACVIDTSDEDAREALQNICNLTLLPGEDIVELLTTSLISPRSLWRRHTTYRRNLQNVETCRSRLHGIVRYLYSRLFHWLVNRINEMLTVQTDHGNWLGILDIFGFESFDVNGIEQLCVNYSNERLQLYFMEEYLERSRRDLEEEGLTDLPPSQSMNNYQERLSIIEGRLFTALNDACLSPVAVDLSVLNSRLFSYQDGTRKFISSKGQVFVIKHYSCPVEYSIPDLLSKNIDKVPSDELLSTFGLSGNDFLRRLINTDEEISQDRNIYAKRRTTLARLKHNLDVLIKELSKCDSHYVRCVRPGDADRWVKAEFSKQLAHTGVLDALPLTRCKFPIRLRYEEFCKRYSKHFTDTSHDSKEQSKKIIKQTMGQEVQQFSVHFGNRLIFLTENIFHKLEIDRQKYRSQCVAKIQHFWAKYKSRTTPNESSRKSITRCKEKRLIEIPRMSDITRKTSQNSSDDDVFLSEDVESSPYCFVDIEGKVTTLAPITSAPAIATSTSQSKNEQSERSDGSKVASDDDPTNRYLETCNHFSCNSFTLDEMHRTSSPDCASREFEWTNKLQIDSNENVIPSLVVEDDTIRESTKIPGEKYNESGYAANGSSYSKFSAKQCHSREEYVAQWLYNVSPMPHGNETKEIDTTDVTPERSRNSLRSNTSDLSVEAKTVQGINNNEDNLPKETSAIDKCIPCAAANPMGKEMSTACNKKKSFTKRQPTVSLSSWDSTSNVVRIDDCVFFYKNRILSRRRISEVPVRFHTRLTCLADSHRLPRSELPNGLQDCL